VGAVRAAALGPHSGPRPRPRKREKSSLSFRCDFCGWYNFGKIIKIVTTGCHTLKLRCTKFDFGWGAYSAPPDSKLDLKGRTSKGKEGGREGGGRGRKGEKGGRKGVRGGEIAGKGST